MDFVYKDTLMLINCLMAHYAPYLGKLLKIMLYITKIYTGKMLLILLPEINIPIMMNPFIKRILARLP